MSQPLRYDYDEETNALYIYLPYLADRPYAYGRDLDDQGRIDYAADGTPIGGELTCVRSGVAVDGLAAAERIVNTLDDLQLPILG